jgi:hypothetical protein
MKKPNETPVTTYRVGYRKPPTTHQFRMGRSGNLRGRQPNEQNIVSIFKRIALKRVKVNDGGTIKTMSFAEAIILQNYRAAVQGDQNAMGNILRLAERAGEFKDWTDPKVVGRPIFFPRKSLNDEEFNAEAGVGIVYIPARQTNGSSED